MKVNIPEQLKSDVPQTTWGKILTATPVVMAVLSTMLAGLASSEMTRAQYDRSLAAQQQSKAGDQWSFFQAKRMRGALQRNTADLMQSTVEAHLLDAASLRKAFDPPTPGSAAAEAEGERAKLKAELASVLESPAGREAIDFLRRSEVPSQVKPVAPPENIKAALEVVEKMRPDAEVASALAAVKDEELDGAVASARDQALRFDEATGPINRAIDQVDNLIGRHTALAGLSAAGVASAARDFTLARLKYAALRYETEARLNQAIANLFELQVRKSNLSAERHHRRSQRFFFGMLGAQTGVIISTVAMAARKRNVLWAIAAAAGLIAVAFAIYVYLYV